MSFRTPLSLTHLYLNEFYDDENLMKLKSLEYLSVSGFRVHGAGKKDQMAKEYGKQIFESYPKLK